MQKNEYFAHFVLEFEDDILSIGELNDEQLQIFLQYFEEEKERAIDYRKQRPPEQFPLLEVEYHSSFDKIKDDKVRRHVLCNEMVNVYLVRIFPKTAYNDKRHKLLYKETFASANPHLQMCHAVASRLRGEHTTPTPRKLDSIPSHTPPHVSAASATNGEIIPTVVYGDPAIVRSDDEPLPTVILNVDEIAEKIGVAVAGTVTQNEQPEQNNITETIVEHLSIPERQKWFYEQKILNPKKSNRALAAEYKGKYGGDAPLSESTVRNDINSHYQKLYPGKTLPPQKKGRKEGQ